eukprot:8277600-Alexandrium_andersonii.AAC.1
MTARAFRRRSLVPPPDACAKPEALLPPACRETAQPNGRGPERFSTQAFMPRPHGHGDATLVGLFGLPARNLEIQVPERSHGREADLFEHRVD